MHCTRGEHLFNGTVVLEGDKAAKQDTLMPAQRGDQTSPSDRDHAWISFSTKDVYSNM